MEKAGLVAAVLLFAVAAVGLHGAACGAHALAVEIMWARNPNTLDKYRWSHAYCKVVAAPLSFLIPRG